MNFSIVCCKNRKKFDKYVKINRVRNKVIIDIRQFIEEENIDPEHHKDYFNLLVYTRVMHSIKKCKDIYYIPNFLNPNINITDLFNIKNMLTEMNIKFNILVYYDEFREDEQILKDVMENLSLFDSSQIMKDY